MAFAVDMLLVFCEEGNAFLYVIFLNLKYSVTLVAKNNVMKCTERKKLKHTNVTSVLDRAE